MDSKFILLGITLMLLSCKKDQEPTVQELLDKGTEISVLLEDYPADSLLGKELNGGWIFYVEEDEAAVRIVSAVDFSAQAIWGCAGNEIEGADSLGVGYGKWNTEDIIAACSDPNSAAGHCYYSNYKGFTDWVLPSAEEMFFVWENVFNKDIGNFETEKYWTSTEESATEAVHLDFSSGNLNFSNKTAFYRVRAVRRSEQ